MELYSVVNGVKKNLEDVNDEAFSQKMLGDGIAIIPHDGQVVAPIDSEVTMLFPTCHAIGLKTQEGLEILIHIGIDTVEMNGDGFEAFVKQGDKVKQGQVLIQFDLTKIKKLGYEPDTMVIMTNSKQYSSLKITSLNDLTIHDLLLEIE